MKWLEITLQPKVTLIYAKSMLLYIAFNEWKRNAFEFVIYLFFVMLLNLQNCLEPKKARNKQNWDNCGWWRKVAQKCCSKNFKPMQTFHTFKPVGRGKKWWKKNRLVICNQFKAFN